MNRTTEMLLRRYLYTDTTTIGKLYINGVFFCYTLEDAVRGDHIKVMGKTAILAMTYRVVLSLSTRFKKILPEILNVPYFVGIRMHGGNKHEDTEGCVVVAEKLIDDKTVQGSMSDTLVKELSKYKDIYLTIINLPNV